MKAYYSDHFDLELPVGHRFPMAKYRLLREQLTSEMRPVELWESPPATDGQLALVHQPDYVQAVADGSLSPLAQREIGFPWSLALAERARRSVGATVAAARTALAEGMSASLAGGTHHAYADRGSGFCVFNDVAVAARLVQAQWAARSSSVAWHPTSRLGSELNVAIVDLDVHQGNGTASIFRHDESVFTLSLHGERNFPFRKEPSDLDVELSDGCDDDGYLCALDDALRQLDTRFAPGLVLFLAGADPLASDRLGRLSLSAEGLAERDRRVFQWCWERRVPVAFVMAGGYAVPIQETVAVHCNTFRVAASYWSRWQSLGKASSEPAVAGTMIA